MLKQLGKYQIQKLLGQGAMGEVYLAHHPTIGRDVAIKTILPSVASGPDAETRFRREATAAGKLNHPNIVTIYDFEKDGELLYLVMEYVKGEDLEEIIAQQSMTPLQFLEVLAQVCDGLAYAHMHGIIHRDIKPANIRVVRDGKRILAKVMDFGIARTEDSSMTATGIVMGTVSYMAPDYIQSGHSSAQGDLWAVGVMLYECLSGHKPFGGDNITTILFRIVSDAPPPIDPKNLQGISPSIRDILSSVLSKDPTQRIQTAEELARRLRACKDPTWEGDLKATLAMPSGLPDPNATQLLTSASAPTTLVPAGHAAPTLSIPPTQQKAPAGDMNGGGAPLSRGVLAGAAFALLALVGGGAYFLRGRKNSAPVLPVEGGSASASPAGNGAGLAPPTSTPVPTAATVSTPTAPASAAAQPLATPPRPQLQANQAPVPPPLSKPAPPLPVEEPPAAKLAKAVALLPSDANQAEGILRGLAAAQPGDASIQGNLLAACYRLGNASEFERALDSAKAHGLSGPQMMKAAPSFRSAMAEELRAHKAKNGTNLLSLVTVGKIVN